MKTGDTMKIIISPAKKMRVDNDTFVPLSKPTFLDKTEKIKEALLEVMNQMNHFHLQLLYL